MAGLVWRRALGRGELPEAEGVRVTQPAELLPALERAISANGPSLVEIISDPELI